MRNRADASHIISFVSIEVAWVIVATTAQRICNWVTNSAPPLN